MADIATVVVNATDARRAARFWAAALGYMPRPDNPLILVPPDGAGPAIQVDETDRMHLDLRTASAAEQRAEIDRLVAAGATRLLNGGGSLSRIAALLNQVLALI